MRHCALVDLKRFTVHDGPGIRTTVFLKGCSLACIWCHNPESLRTEPQIGFLQRKCALCGACAAACPNGCHSVVNGKHLIDRAKCTACGRCVRACLHDALVLYGRRVSVEDIAKAVLEDRAFYEYSGGGATVSGGEPLLQVDFCVALFQRLKEEKIHCAVDTAGDVPWRAFKKIVPFTDMFLYDLKHTDTVRHKEGTGRGNELILENLLRLSDCGKPIEIRIPLIPGYNNDGETLKTMAAFLDKLDNITGVEIVPYHSLARSKYAAVGMPDTMPRVASPTADELNAAKSFFTRSAASQ